VIGAQARLIAQWQLVGFIHGVMNTDNSSVAGETIDYGPCAFMDGYHPGTVYSSIDHAGRYAYGNQPRIGLWNLTRFAETLLPLLAEGEVAIEIAQSKLQGYAGQFESAYAAGLRRKLGLMRAEDGDFALAQRELAANFVHGRPGVAERQRREVRDGKPGDFYRQAFGPEPALVASRAGRRGHVLREPFAVGIGIRIGEAAFQMSDHAFKIQALGRGILGRIAVQNQILRFARKRLQLTPASGRIARPASALS